MSAKMGSTHAPGTEKMRKSMFAQFRPQSEKPPAALTPDSTAIRVRQVAFGPLVLPIAPTTGGFGNVGPRQFEIETRKTIEGGSRRIRHPKPNADHSPRPDVSDLCVEALGVAGQATDMVTYLDACLVVDSAFTDHHAYTLQSTPILAATNAGMVSWEEMLAAPSRP